MICDTYSNERTIKDFKRDRRGNVEATYSSQGCNETRPTDFNRVYVVQVCIDHFLAYEIMSQHYKDIINEKTVFLPGNDHELGFKWIIIR